MSQLKSTNEKHPGLKGIQFSQKENYCEDKTEKELIAIFHSIMEEGMHGICYSAYEEGQEPGNTLSREQIQKRMETLAPHTKWLRTFSCIEGNELIPQVAHEFGIKTLVGAWLGDDKEKNEEEITALIQLAKDGHVDIAAVGNEVLYRNDMSKEELLGYIYRVKEAIPEIPVGYVDAYYEFTRHPDISEACDVILSNCYPYWEECDLDYSLTYMKKMVEMASAAAKGKKVIITETGWPSFGTNCGNAYPSKENALKYFINTQLWAKEDNIDVFYFTSFDELWKVGAEGDVGAFWGLWDKDGKLKY